MFTFHVVPIENHAWNRQWRRDVDVLPRCYFDSVELSVLDVCFIFSCAFFCRVTVHDARGISEIA